MIDNIEITISSQAWPKLKLILKAGTQVQTHEARWDQAAAKFGDITKELVSSVVNTQTKRRTDHGST